MGYVMHDDGEPAIKCATSDGDVYAAPSWDAIVHHAKHYELCACGVHELAFYKKEEA
jgi:hypothetical protein